MAGKAAPNPETEEGPKPLTIRQVHARIQRALITEFGHAPFLVEGTVLTLGVKKNRYVNFKLAELVGGAGENAAELNCYIWSLHDYNRICAKLLEETGYRFEESLQAVLSVRLTYHPTWGISLEVSDIDTRRTLGNQLAQKQRTLNRLQADPRCASNRRAVLPLVPQRIAVISAQDARGYEDFAATITRNSGGYQFHSVLFPVTLQGARAAQTIRTAIVQIYRASRPFDAIALVRGGGNETSLMCFDSFEVAEAVGRCPIPIIAGIGHTKNRTATDEVAYRSAKTPTEAGQFFVDCLAKFEADLNQSLLEIRESVIGYSKAMTREMDGTFRDIQSSRRAIEGRAQELQMLTYGLGRSVDRRMSAELSVVGGHHAALTLMAKERLEAEERTLNHHAEGIPLRTTALCRTHEQHLEGLKKMTYLLDPERLLQKGYALIQRNGRTIKSAAELSQGDRLTLRLHDGSREAEVKE